MREGGGLTGKPAVGAASQRATKRKAGSWKEEGKRKRKPKALVWTSAVGWAGFATARFAGGGLCH